jgi:predicted nucleotidyltransferase
LESGKFSETGSVQRLRFGTLPVDLLPFGGIETVAGTIVWPQDSGEMNMIGFREALARTDTVRLPGNTEVKVASLPTQALLKLLTWSELQLARAAKDALDFRTLAKTYCRVAGQERLAAEQELLAREDFDYEAAGAWLLGRDAGLMHREAPMFTASAGAVFTRPTGRANMQTLVASMGGHSMEENIRLAEWFRDGLQSGLK